MITLEEAKNHLHVDGTDDDVAIADMIETAKAHVENYLGLGYPEGTVPAPVKSAALLLVGELYDNREITSENPIYTNRIFAQLLNPYRAMEM
jgi:hypothetical protein